MWSGYALPCVMSTADISEGSSGGALLNVYGQAVAVTSGAYVYGNSMYLAVPIDPILTADLTGEGLTPAGSPRGGNRRLNTEAPERGRPMGAASFRIQWVRMNCSSSSGVRTTATAPLSASSPGAA